MNKNLGVSALALALAASAQANEIYSHIGTEGIGIGYGQEVGRAGVRAEVNLGSYSKTVSHDDIDYDAKLKLSGAGVYGDWFVFDDGFRLTGGLTYNDKGLSGTGRSSSSTVNLNGTDYSIVGEELHARVRYPKFMPYVGIGWGHHASRKGWGMSADLGIMYGKPDATLSATPGLANAAASDIEAERQSLQRDVDSAKFFPVVKVGLTYRF
jgi:hypothetical protein